jgi:hypothetical protein
MMKLHRFTVQQGRGELLDRFLDLRRTLYVDDFYHYPEHSIERWLLEYYAERPDYSFELIVGESRDRGDVARVLVGRCETYDFGFFGYFECPNNRESFRILMDCACDVARERGAESLVGPIELNALHGWMFLDAAESDVRWVGDPYHRRFYPQLFRHAGWSIAERSVSGVLWPGAHAALLADGARVLESMEKLGIRAYTRGELPEEESLRDVYGLVSEAFPVSLHRYVPVEFEVFKAQVTLMRDHLSDPGATLLLYRGEECVAFCLAYDNFIRELCDPEDRKVPPAGDGEGRGPFSIKTTAISSAFRGQGLSRTILVLSAQHAEARYRQPLGWRRTNVRNPGTEFVQANSRITQTYATFSRSLAG